MVDIWTHHLLSFILPSERHVRAWFISIVLQELLMVRELRDSVDDQLFYDLHDIRIVSKRRRPHMLDVSSNSRYEYSTDTRFLQVEIWCWVWSEGYGLYHSDYVSILFEIVPSGFRDHHNKIYVQLGILPDEIKQDDNGNVVCLICQRENVARKCTFKVQGQDITFLACRSHIQKLVEEGVIGETNKMLFKVELCVEKNETDVLEDTVSIRESMCE